MSFQRTWIGWTLAIALSTALLGCNNDDGSDKTANPKGGKITDKTANPNASQVIHVTDASGAPLPQAQVLIGDGMGRPISDNFLTTDAQGSFTAPSSWTVAESVTIAAAGFVRATYLKQTPKGQTFQLRPDNFGKTIELTGQTTGFSLHDNSGTVELGAVIPALARQDIFGFSIDMVMSGQNDNMSVFGKNVSIPSNVTLPNQKQTYDFVPVSFGKPTYRVYFPTSGAHNVFAGHGQISLNTVIDAAKNHTPLYQLLNELHLVGGSIQSVTLGQTTTSLDLPINQLAFTTKHSFQAPTVSSSQTFVGMALGQYGKEFYLNDIKQADQAGTMNLMTDQSPSPYLAAVLKNKSEFASGAGRFRLSTELTPLQEGMTPVLLPLQDNPVVTNPGSFSVPALVSPPTNVEPKASYALLSLVTPNTQELHHLWEIYDPEWSTAYTLPEWPNDNLPAGGKRWEVSRLGQLSGVPPTDANGLDLGPSLFEHYTHATRSTVDF